MKFLRQREIAIAGYAETPIRRRSGLTALELAADALQLLLTRTGLRLDQIDGVALTMAQSEVGDAFWSNLVVETLGLRTTWLQTSDLGGASVIANVARASAAIHAGMCETVVCLAADAPSDRIQMQPTGYRREFSESVGYSGPPMVFGLLSSAYAARHGLPSEALAKLAVTQRAGALLNANACASLRVPLTREDYLSSRLIADPVRMLDCVMRCDGASAILVTTTANARKLNLPTVHPTAYRELSNADPTSAGDDITQSGFAIAGPLALADAGMAASDIHMLHAYDDFLIAVLLQLEQIGFCAIGESGNFIMERDISHRGSLPINTGGGQISAGQPGLASGGVNCVEAVRQLMREAGERQVVKATNAMVTGIGSMQYAGNWGTSAVLILEAA